MDTPAGCRRTPGTTQRAAGTILGSVTIPGSPKEVSRVRAFIARSLGAVPGVDSDAATLLTSELVTNAILHTGSGTAGGTVTVVVTRVRGGVLVEVTDGGSPDTPTVKADVRTTDGHGLFLVQQIATRWGYLREPAGTTVWFHLAAGESGPPAEEAAGSAGAEEAAGAEDGYPAAASTAASTPAQIAARSSSPVTYGGIV
ncbi:MAG TPA: ATP-binding protein [Trebonia sp.]|jgi:anti-sigma regulatory factor (Ser/Thr protein kinase)|nr:ATP-binding protein [Trebonia sp.]